MNTTTDHAGDVANRVDEVRSGLAEIRGDLAFLLTELAEEVEADRGYFEGDDRLSADA